MYVLFAYTLGFIPCYNFCLLDVAEAQVDGLLYPVDMSSRKVP